jgi:hypothetical protein
METCDKISGKRVLQFGVAAVVSVGLGFVSGPLVGGAFFMGWVAGFVNGVL